MARFTINSREHGARDFFVPDHGGYVRLETGSNHGTLGQQICYGGDFFGNTITADKATLETEARKWWKSYLRNERLA